MTFCFAADQGAAFATFAARAYRFIAVDVETANSAASSICQIGLAGVDAQGAIHSFACYIDPEDRFSGFNVKLHGIDAQMVAGSPAFAQGFAALAPVLGRAPLVQHSSFDKTAFHAACTRAALALPLAWVWHDSLRVARRAWPELKANGGHGLGNLKRHLGLSFRHHDAGEDARAAAMVILRAEAHCGISFEMLLAGTEKRLAQPA